MEYRRLFQPGQIGRMQLKNRLVMPAMGTGYADAQGHVSAWSKRYYGERAKGGVGLIITEVTTVVPTGGSQLSVADDECIPGLSELAEVIHKGGAKTALQLWHSGTQHLVADTPPETVGPSPIPNPYGEIPRQLAAEEIQDIVRRFAAGAVRAQKAGFDAVEIHGAHGYLIAQFLSAANNQRRDEYGGSLENRARFLLEVIRAIRGAVGPDFPVWCRINAQEYLPGGNQIADTRLVAQWAEAAGANAIHASARGFAFHGSATIPQQPGILAPLAAAIKEVVGVPVIAVARLDHELGERILAEGGADFIAMGRRLIADPWIHQKVFEGRTEDVNPCIACNECIDFLPVRRLRCAVNPAVGTLEENDIQPSDRAKKVVVVGAGPAGLKAATTAALRGHRVTLVEKSSNLGGQLNLAAIPPEKGDIAKLVSYLAFQTKKAGVRVETNTEATFDYLSRLEPDVVVFATGAVPQRTGIPGAHGANVVDAADVLQEKVHVGQEVVVIGGGMVGCETAHFLATKGKHVTIVELLEVLASKMSVAARARHVSLLADSGVRMVTGARCQEIRENELVIAVNGQQQIITADAFVLATGYDPDVSLYRETKDKIPETHLIGDALEPRNLGEAIRDGFRIGLSI